MRYAVPGLILLFVATHLAHAQDAPGTRRFGFITLLNTTPPEKYVPATTTSDELQLNDQTPPAAPPAPVAPRRSWTSRFKRTNAAPKVQVSANTPELLPPEDPSASPAPLTAPIQGEVQPPQPLPYPTLLPKGQENLTEQPSLDVLEVTDAVVPGCRWWTGVEYLLWRTQHPGLGYPIETATVAGTGTGVLGNSLTVKYFDGSNMNYGNYSGARVTVGRWLDPTDTWAAEANAFFLIPPGVHFSSVASLTSPSLVGANGIPASPIAIYRPYVNAATLASSALFLGNQVVASNGLPQPGSLRVDSSSMLWGGEANLFRNIYRTDTLQIYALAGARYLDLKEDLNVLSVSTQPTSTLLQYNVIDRFMTHNQFVGGQLGARFDCQKGNLLIRLTPRVAFGDNFQLENIGGITNAYNGSINAVYRGGFLALPSNSGEFTKQQFGIVPQLGLTLGYQVGSHCRFYMGYDFLYWSNVARPGDQINPTLNPSQVPSLTPNQPNAPALQPQPLFVSRSFWAEGVNVGVEVRY